MLLRENPVAMRSVSSIAGRNALDDMNTFHVRSGRFQSRPKCVRRVILSTQKQNVAGLAFLAAYWPVPAGCYHCRDAPRDLTLSQTRIAGNDRELSACNPVRPKPANRLRLNFRHAPGYECAYGRRSRSIRR